ncbi:hypothetical protein K438DRAFT_1964439 [Mycena galopus ATCC 62051]|nr:hypothetical protein K438DRAFT_1964439 [Mycena galopus ATCC 62051]
MTTIQRLIYFDDTNPVIQFSANQWFLVDVTPLNALGTNGSGPVYNGTTHSTTVDGATLNFAFNGSSLSVFGTTQTKDLVDGFFNVTENENNGILCYGPELPPVPHSLAIAVQTKGQPFYLDCIQYTPTIAIDGAVVSYPNDDPAASYGTGWQSE